MAHLSNTPARHPIAVLKSYSPTSCLLGLNFLHLDHPIEPCN